MGNDCGTGVAFTRNPSTGENKLYGEFLMNAQGEDVVAGIRTPQKIDQLKEVAPSAYDDFVAITKRLELTIVICKTWNLQLKKVNCSCCRHVMVNVQHRLL